MWWNPERFAKGATVGAPPDMFNQQGQNWSQPPLSPINLETTGYEAYRNMVHGMFARAGAVRIDHILGLFRLWWIPENRSAMDGAYVYYDSDIMLGVLAIEASRAGGVVVGEDLGVVPDHVADSLSSHGILGCAVEWFEQCDGVFRAPSQWRPYALASVNTHDLPPAAGYLEYEHVKIRERLGLLTGPAEEFEASAKAEQDAMLAMLVEQGYLDADFAEHREDHEADIVDALYRALKGSPCKLLAASITDAVGRSVRRTSRAPTTNTRTGASHWPTPRATWYRSKPSSTPPVPNASPKSSIPDPLYLPLTSRVVKRTVQWTVRRRGLKEAIAERRQGNCLTVGESVSRSGWERNHK